MCIWTKNEATPRFYANILKYMVTGQAHPITPEAGKKGSFFTGILHKKLLT